MSGIAIHNRRRRQRVVFGVLVSAIAALYGCRDASPTAPSPDFAQTAVSQPAAPPQDTAPPAPAPADFPRGRWLDTGISIESGASVALAASGTIDMWPDCEQTKANEGFPNLDCAIVQFVTPAGTPAFD